jgi:hypothetical protein
VDEPGKEGVRRGPWTKKSVKVHLRGFLSSYLGNGFVYIAFHLNTQVIRPTSEGTENQGVSDMKIARILSVVLFAIAVFMAFGASEQKAYASGTAPRPWCMPGENCGLQSGTAPRPWCMPGENCGLVAKTAAKPVAAHR